MGNGSSRRLALSGGGTQKEMRIAMRRGPPRFVEVEDDMRKQKYLFFQAPTAIGFGGCIDYRFSSRIVLLRNFL
jgi:hypothetical protein